MNLKEALLKSIDIILEEYDPTNKIGVLDLSLSNTVTDDSIVSNFFKNNTTKISTINVEIIEMTDGSFELEETSISEKIYNESNRLKSSKHKVIK